MKGPPDCYRSTPLAFNNPNKSQIIIPSETLVLNASFLSLAPETQAKCKNNGNNLDLFSQKWVLNKLIDMECERIEQIKSTLPQIQQKDQTKEELLSVCLDIVTNQSIKNNNPAERSLLEGLYHESQEIITSSMMKSLNIFDKSEHKPNDFLSKSVELIKENEFIAQKTANKSTTMRKTENEEVKNDCEIIIFSESSQADHLNISKKSEKGDNKLDNPCSIIEILQEVKKESNDENLSPILIKRKPSEESNADIVHVQNNNYMENNENQKSKTLAKSYSLTEEPDKIPPKHRENPKSQTFYFAQNTEGRKTNAVILKIPGKGEISVKSPEMFPFNSPPKPVDLLPNPPLKLSSETLQEELKSCDICLDVLPKHKQQKAGKCEDLFCRACIRTHLIESIKSGRVLEIPCPKEGCRYKYTDEEVKAVLEKDPELIKKYEKFKLQISLAKDESVRWCIRPDCDRYMKGSAANPKLECVCGEVICFNCSRRWHEGKTCVELMDLEYESYRQKMNIMPCPKCKSRIEKISGCNHMTCTRCRYEFCWICGKKYSKLHFRKYNIFGCPGMIYQPIQRDKALRKKLILAKISAVFKLLGFILLLFMLPLIGVLTLFCLPNIIFVQGRRKRNLCECGELCRVFLLFLLGVVISPVVLALGIFPGSCLLCCWSLFRPRHFAHRGRPRRRFR